MGRPPPTIAAAPARGTRPRRAEPSQCRHRGPVRTQPPPASSPTAAERVSSMSPGVVAQVMTQGLIIIPQLKQLSKNQLFPMNFVTKGACRRKAGETGRRGVLRLPSGFVLIPASPSALKAPGAGYRPPQPGERRPLQKERVRTKATDQLCA